MKEIEGILSEEALKSSLELADVLRKSHNRLLAEGKIIRKEGKTIFLYNKNSK